MKPVPQNSIRPLQMGLIFEAALAFAAVALAWTFGVPLREQFPASGTDLLAAVGRGCLATVPMLVAFGLLTRSRWPPFRRLRRQVRQLVGQLIQNATIVEIAGLSIVAGIGEELLFRGVIQPLAIRWTTPGVGLAAASLLFGLAHYISKTYFVLASLVGVYLGWLALDHGEIATPITTHALYDFCVLWWIARKWRATV
jgi:membrane protease YdiL (CAAX protease family)